MGMMSWKELVVEARRTPITELKFPISCGKIGEARRCLVQSPGTKVHGEPPHLARVAKERAPPHGRQLLQSPLLAALVLEPHLEAGASITSALSRNLLATFQLRFDFSLTP